MTLTGSPDTGTSSPHVTLRSQALDHSQDVATRGEVAGQEAPGEAEEERTAGAPAATAAEAAPATTEAKAVPAVTEAEAEAEQMQMQTPGSPGGARSPPRRSPAAS